LLDDLIDKKKRRTMRNETRNFGHSEK